MIQKECRIMAQKKPVEVDSHAIASLPDKPAVYAMYGGRGRFSFVAYVGETANLKTRLQQHLIRHVTSITSGVGAVNLNPDAITRVEWWQHSDFRNDTKREAAELIAACVLDPVMRSNNLISAEARLKADEDEFRKKMLTLFESGNFSGRLNIKTLDDALVDIEEHENRIAKLEASLERLNAQIKSLS